MIKFGYSISSEQLNPSEIVETAKKAEEYGFDFIMISDHFHPWIDKQGESAFVWSMIGAMSQVTDVIPIGTGVTATTIRIHPAILAQATATVARLLGDNRFLFGIGSGENLNEHVVGEGWPPIEIRHAMFRESIEIIKELWKGKNTTIYGNFYTVEDARIYTTPDNIPPIIVSAYGSKAAKIAGELGDGLVTTMVDEKVVQTFKDNGGNGKPMYIQFSVSYDEDEEKAIDNAYNIWPIAGLKGNLNTELRTPMDYEKAIQMVKKEDISEAMPCGPNLTKYKEQIQQAIDSGFDHIYLNQVGKEQEKFMQFYKTHIIPVFK